MKVVKFKKIVFNVAGRIERAAVFNMYVNLNSLAMFSKTYKGYDLFFLSGNSASIEEIDDIVLFQKAMNLENENKTV